MDSYYKYLPCERISYINDELLRFTQPSALNDPFECLPQKPDEEKFRKTIAVIKNATLKLGFPASKRLDQLSAEKLYLEAYQNINNEIGILSLSQNWNNALMWAHYTNSHKGFCLGFDKKHRLFRYYLSKGTEESISTHEVVYSKNRVEIPLDFREKKITFEPYITKSIDWQYEQEIRVLATLNLCEKKINSTPVDICLFKVPHNSIKEIIMGLNIDNNTETQITDFCKKNSISLFKSKLSETLFDMSRIQIL